jgi:hypothetical protein
MLVTRAYLPRSTQAMKLTQLIQALHTLISQLMHVFTLGILSAAAYIYMRACRSKAN